MVKLIDVVVVLFLLMVLCSNLIVFICFEIPILTLNVDLTFLFSFADQSLQYSSVELVGAGVTSLVPSSNNNNSVVTSTTASLIDNVGMSQSTEGGNANASDQVRLTPCESFLLKYKIYTYSDIGTAISPSRSTTLWQQ